MTTPAVVSFAEAAATLDLSPRTAYRLLADGTFPLPVITIGPRKRVVSRARLHAFIEGDLPVASVASATATPQFPPERGEVEAIDGADESSSRAAMPASAVRRKPRASSSQGVTATARAASSGSTSRKRAGAQTPALPRSAAS